MSTQWELPNIGEGVEEADVAEILVSVGQTVEANQPLMELETEKAVVELPAPGAGVIQKILVNAGDSLKVGQAYAVVDSLGDSPVVVPVSETAASSSSPEVTATETAPPAAEVPSPPATQASKTEMVTGTIDFKLPPLGEGVNSADVAEIMVAVGETVAIGDGLMELETEKAVVELPSEHQGKITKIHVSEGESVAVGSVVITFEATSSVATAQSASPVPAASQAASSVKSEPAASTSTPIAKSSPAVPSPTSSRTNGTPVPAAPSTRRLARELGVNLHDVQGTGAGGRILQGDVQAYVKSRLQGTALSRTSTTASGMNLAAGSLAPPPLPDFSKYGVIEREKMNKLSRTAAENLTVSWNVIPHVTQHDRADITDLEAARKRFGHGVGKNGPKVTMTAIVIKALTTCLQAYPKFNSSLDPETNEIVYKKYYNIGCAVDTPNGLVVPVIKNCDQRSILQIAADVTDLAVKARDRKLAMDDMQGATCTVTNLGGIGGVGFTPIVNYPEVCILGMSRGQNELRLVDGQVTERLMLPVSLSYDHRVVNGADAARFVVTFCNLLADPFQLLTTV